MQETLAVITICDPIGYGDKMRPISMLVIMTLFMLCFCNKEPLDISGTKWVYNFNPDLADSLIFMDTLYIHYSAEIDIRYYGKYQVQNDTIYLKEEGEIWVYDPPRYVPNEEYMSKRKMILNAEDNLQFVPPLLRFVNGRWIDTGFKYDENYVFYQIN